MRTWDVRAAIWGVIGLVWLYVLCRLVVSYGYRLWRTGRLHGESTLPDDSLDKSRW